MEALGARSVAAKPAGKIFREYWLKVPGSKMPDLKNHAAYPDRPSGRDFLTKLEAPAQFAEEFGARIRGYVHPPISGMYTFWVCSDDNAEVWLSSDETPATRRKICSLDGAAKPGDWEYQPTTRSGAIPLRAGRRYYIEVLHKDGSLEDHVAVGWRLPNGTMERPIPGSRLSPPGSGSSAREAAGEKKKFYRGINLNGPGVTMNPSLMKRS